MTFTTAALIVTWVAILLLAFALAGMVRQVHALMVGQGVRFNAVGPPLRSPAPPLTDPDGYSHERPSVLLFVDSTCQVCDRVLAEFASLAEGSAELGSDSEFFAVFAGDENGFHSARVNVLPHRSDAFQSFQIPATPFAVLVTSKGKIERAAPIGSPEMLQRFVSTQRR